MCTKHPIFFLTYTFPAGAISSSNHLLSCIKHRVAKTGTQTVRSPSLISLASKLSFAKVVCPNHRYSALQLPTEGGIASL